MPAFLAGLAALLLLIFGARQLARADPQKAALVLRKVGGIALLVVAALLTLRGALPLAIPLALFGLALLGLPLGSLIGARGPLGGTSYKSEGQRSEVRTESLEMELDHDSGRMEGRCLKGRFAGRALSSLSESELALLLEELRAKDEQSALLVEAYLDRRGEGGGDRRSHGAAKEEPRAGPRARMSSKEAYAVLGLGGGASEAEIRSAHRKLMMKLHPDQGGSDYLAARINEAKEVLLGGK